MKIHTTNYFNTLIEVAEDCPVNISEIPSEDTNKPSVARLQYELLYNHPYELTSDDVLFKVFAMRQDLSKSELDSERKQFFSKGQACLRASPLTKRYGWGVHSDAQGKVALVEQGTETYSSFQQDDRVQKVKAMRSKRAEK